MAKKLICLAVCLVLICSSSLAAFAEALSTYELLDAATEANEACDNTDEQLVVATEYILRLTTVALQNLDAKQQLTKQIEAILTADATDVQRSQSSTQKAVSHLYATADMLALMASTLDDDSHASEIAAAQAKLSSFCIAALDQQAIGADVIFDLTSIIASELDLGGDWKDQIATVSADHAASAQQAHSALQRTANSMYRTVSMLCIVASQLDHRAKWTSAVEDIQDLLESLDNVCISSYQQCVNGCYRCMEIMAVVALALESYL